MPHKVMVSAGTQTCYLVPCFKALWPHPFWAVRRLRDAPACNTALGPIKDSVVHSTVTIARLEPPTQRHVYTETVTVPVLMNMTAISAGEELVLHVPLAAVTPEKRGCAKPSKRNKSWLEDAMKHEVMQRKTARTS